MPQLPRALSRWCACGLGTANRKRVDFFIADFVDACAFQPHCTSTGNCAQWRRPEARGQCTRQLFAGLQAQVLSEGLSAGPPVGACLGGALNPELAMGISKGDLHYIHVDPHAPAPAVPVLYPCCRHSVVYGRARCRSPVVVGSCRNAQPRCVPKIRESPSKSCVLVHASHRARFLAALNEQSNGVLQACWLLVKGLLKRCEYWLALLLDKNSTEFGALRLGLGWRCCLGLRLSWPQFWW